MQHGGRGPSVGTCRSKAHQLQRKMCNMPMESHLTMFPQKQLSSHTAPCCSPSLQRRQHGHGSPCQHDSSLEQLGHEYSRATQGQRQCQEYVVVGPGGLPHLVHSRRGTHWCFGLHWVQIHVLPECKLVTTTIGLVGVCVCLGFIERLFF